MNHCVKSMPNAWRYDRLKDVATINARSLGADTRSDREIDYLEISNVSPLGIVDRDAIEHLSFGEAPSRARRCVCEGATIISSVRPNLQAIAYIDKCDSHLICSTGFNVVSSRHKNVTPRFLYYCLLSDDAKQYFVATAKGVGYPAIDDKEFGTYDIPIPPRDEQERIAAFLDAKCADVDKAIAAKRKQLENIDEIWENTLAKSVTQGVKNNHSFVATDDFRIPKLPSGWRFEKIARCFDLIGSGTTPKSHMLDYYDGNIPWLQSGDLHGRYIDHTEKCVNEQACEDCNLRIYQAPFIAVAMYGASIANLSIVRIDACTNQACCTLCQPRHLIHPDYAYYAIAASRETLLQAAHGGTQPNISREVVRRLKIPIPPKQEQVEIAKYLDARRANLDALAANLRKQIETLEQYRKSLIHECVTGARRCG